MYAVAVVPSSKVHGCRWHDEACLKFKELQINLALASTCKYCEPLYHAASYTVSINSGGFQKIYFLNSTTWYSCWNLAQLFISITTMQYSFTVL